MRVTVLTAVVLALSVVSGYAKPGLEAHDVNSFIVPAGYINLIESNEIEPHEEQSMMSSVNVKATLGMIEYLILLILLKGSLGHVAERYSDSLKPLRDARRRRRQVSVRDPWSERSNHDDHLIKPSSFIEKLNHVKF